MCPYAFVEITPGTSEGQILNGGRTTQRFGKYMFNMQRSPCDAFRTQTVFAPMVCTFGNSSAQSWRNIRHDLSSIPTQTVWQETTLFEQKECSGLSQR
jgi:hypothetical protein